ncbi:MAG: serine hydrolase domain-containing protein [Gemmatimonadota bacterium]
MSPASCPLAACDRRSFLALGATLLAGGSSRLSSTARPDTPRKESWIPSDQLMAELPLLMSVASLPGLAIGVVEDGAVAWTRAVGVANAETRAPVRDDTMFEAASMSKPVFAYVVLRLADEGLIDLDRPLVQYHRPDYLPDGPDLDLITARHVLRHSTGLANWRIRPEDRLIPQFKPGTRFSYSGEGYFWLQIVVEHLTGQGVDSVMRSRLFEPAGMTLSTYAWNAERSRLAVSGHKGPGDGEGQLGFQLNQELGDRLLTVATTWGRPVSTWTYEDAIRGMPEARDLPGPHPLPEPMRKAPIDYFKLPVNLLPNVAGSLGTTATEYAKFLTLMMGGRRRGSWEIAEGTRRVMLDPASEVKANAMWWGLGWAVERPSSGPIFCHGGNNGGLFKTFALGDAARRRAIVVLTNGGGGYAVYQRIIRAAAGYDPLQFMLGG